MYKKTQYMYKITSPPVRDCVTKPTCTRLTKTQRRSKSVAIKTVKSLLKTLQCVRSAVHCTVLRL